MKKVLFIVVVISFFSCQPTIKTKTTATPKFIFTAWVHANGAFKKSVWEKRLAYYDSLGISQILVGASPTMLEQIIPLAQEKNIKVHAWMWTFNRPGDTIAQKHPDWYAVNRKGQNSLEHRAYVNYYQWLSPFNPEARNYIFNNAKKFMHIKGLASIHLDYVRYPDVILGADLQPKYKLVQETEMPEYDYDYHPLARAAFKKVFDKDPLDFKHPELSTEWRQFRLNAITSLVNQIIDSAHAQQVKVTAAVFPFPTMARQMVRQAWNDWHLDTAFPMLYQNFYRENINWIGFATKQDVSDVSFPIISGLYAPALKDPTDLEKAILLAKKNGAAGISIFTADDLSKAQQAVFVKLKKQLQ